jgi:hypothetical protein
MKLDHKKKTQIVQHAPSPAVATVQDILLRAWKPESSSLKREEWRQIVLERLG